MQALLHVAMQTQPVDSSVIRSVGYDRTQQLLQVEFKNGRTYFYLAVPPHIHQALLTAPSLGKFLNERIKPNYRAVRVRQRE